MKSERGSRLLAKYVSQWFARPVGISSKVSRNCAVEFLVVWLGWAALWGRYSSNESGVDPLKDVRGFVVHRPTDRGIDSQRHTGELDS